jgi:A/G-specific adenine glycosylase
MLQQTQVATVLPYYARFLARFPDLATLAAAPLEAVLAAWAGLGYYTRARQLHACAAQVMAGHGGHFPATASALAALPGIGPSTAAAIAAFCHGERAAILDGNVRRVLARYAGIAGDPARQPARDRLQTLAQDLLPPGPDMPGYTQAIMDLGALVCTRARPACGRCPVKSNCVALREGRTAELPTPRARPARPRRPLHLLLAEHRGALLLEKRPARGWWGGLLAPPVHETAQGLLAACAGLGVLQAPQALAVREHAFTHMQLVITPHLLRLGGRRPQAPAGQQWLALTQVRDAAIPAPLRMLIDEISVTTKPHHPSAQD